MGKFVVLCTAYKPSGKYYASKETFLFESPHCTSDHLGTLSDLVAIIRKGNLDKYCGLVDGAIQCNNMKVTIDVLDVDEKKDQRIMTFMI